MKLIYMEFMQIYVITFCMFSKLVWKYDLSLYRNPALHWQITTIIRRWNQSDRKSANTAPTAIQEAIYSAETSETKGAVEEDENWEQWEFSQQKWERHASLRNSQALDEQSQLSSYWALQMSSFLWDKFRIK